MFIPASAVSPCLFLMNASLYLLRTVLNGDVTTCSLLSYYMSVVSVHACLRPSVMWDLDAILAIVTNINSQIIFQMSSEHIAEPSNKKQTSCLSGSVWRPHTKSVFIIQWWRSCSYPVHFRKGIYSAVFFWRYTQVLQDSNMALRSTLRN